MAGDKMDSDAPLIKRVKRHVTGRSHRFFVAVHPGLEAVCLKELKAVLPAVETMEVGSGGIEFVGRLTDCYMANLHLRTANRILMRLDEFSATNFRQLEKRLNSIPWELYLFPKTLTRIHVTTNRSRLYHTEAIAETFNKCIADCFMTPGVGITTERDPAIGQQLFIRAVEDRFTVSMDASGELLYKRGIKRCPGTAPIRETLAAAVLMFAGYRPGEPLMDPMCGSGTFSLEGAMMAKRMPAGVLREFAFTGWPGFRDKQWRFIRRRSESQTIRFKRPLIFASDQDATAVFTLERCIKTHGLSDAIAVSCRDYFQLSPSKVSDRPGLVVINPPYGVRLEAAGKSQGNMESICRKLQLDFTGWKFAIITPHTDFRQRYSLRAKGRPLIHGGLKLMLMTGRVP